MDIMVLGIDLGTTVCSLAGLDGVGAVIFRKRIQRHRLRSFLASLPPCIVAMEACGGAHHVGRFCCQRGNEPRLMSPLYLRPYVKVHKNDDRDAEAIAEAATRPTMPFVEIKSEEQLDLQALHRSRERLVSDRTLLINQARGFLMERGVKEQCIHRQGFDSIQHATRAIGDWFSFDNHRSPHQALHMITPAEAFALAA